MAATMIGVSSGLGNKPTENEEKDIKNIEEEK
mgnify:FL=1